MTCCDFDMDKKLMFIGDQVGQIKCYDIKRIFEFVEKEDELIRIRRASLKENIIIKEDKIKIEQIWKGDLQKHKESIKHLYHVDIEPNIIISTSNDLHVKIINAKDGEIKDELKQISVKYKPVPIGIKYSVNDPFKSPNEQKKEEFIIYRDQVEGHKKENIEEIENQQSKYIFLFNLIFYYYLYSLGIF